MGEDEKKDALIRAQEHIIQSQARLIETLRSRSPFGWFQRRRIRKMQEAESAARYRREDALRQENIQLKQELARK